MDPYASPVYILLASTSALKVKAVEKYFHNRFKAPIVVDTIDCSELKLPAQPISGKGAHIGAAAYLRLQYAKQKKSPRATYDYYIAIENGLHLEKKTDLCKVVIEHQGRLFCGTGIACDPEAPLATQSFRCCLQIPKEYLIKVQAQELIEYSPAVKGYPVTLGTILHQEYPKVDPQDWFSFFKGEDRTTQITRALDDIFNHIKSSDETRKNLLAKYQIYLKFKPGVRFQSYWNMLKDPKSFPVLEQLFRCQYRYAGVDYVAGLESRGYTVGMLAARALGVGFIPVAKEGKLPREETSEVATRTGSTEYSKITLEMYRDIPEGSKILILDDLVATGGTWKVTKDLIEQDLKSTVVDFCALAEVPELREEVQKALDHQSYTVLLGSA